MNSEAQQFCLRWHNYSTSLLASLPRLLDWDDLTDVTLYAGGLSVKAHRIVLSACSQYFKAIFKATNTDEPSLLEPLKITLLTTSLDASGARFVPCGKNVTVHAFVSDHSGTVHKEKLPEGYQITWYCHMRIHPICNVQGRNQLSAVFSDLNCGQRFSPLAEVYNEQTNYVKHAALNPIQIGQAEKSCTMTIDCVKNCDPHIPPGKAVELQVEGLGENNRKTHFGVAVYNGLNGDLLYLGSSLWRFTIQTSQLPIYFKYKIVVSTKSSELNESCSALYRFELQKLFSVGIMTNPLAPLRHEGPRKVNCGTKCVKLTPYCIHGWLVKSETCGLRWVCNDAACGVTEGHQPLLLRNLPCGQTVIIKLVGDSLVRAAHSRPGKMLEWNKVATVILQVSQERQSRRRSIPPEESVADHSSASSKSDPDLHLPSSLQALVDEASTGNCSNPARLRAGSELGPAQHPVIVIPGADFTDLSALVTFMYSGEVTVYRHQLPSLIALADTLAVDGLAHFGKCDDESPPDSVEPAYERGHLELPSPGAHRHGPAKRFKSVDDWAEDGPSTGSVTDSPPCLVPSPTKTMFVRKPQRPPIPLAPSSPPEDLSHKPLEATIKSEDGGVGTSTGPPNSRGPSSKLYATCAVCGKQLSNQYNLRVHMETHRGARYACASCPHVSRSRDALRKHVSYRHPPPSQTSSQATTSTAVGGGTNAVAQSFYHSGPPS